MLSEFSSRKVTVMGLGRFGGGVGITRWLVAQGAHVVVTDIQPAKSLSDSLKEISELIESGRVTLRLGGHVVDDFVSSDLVVVNPAVPKPWDNSFLQAAKTHNIPTTTEIRLLTEQLNRDRVIGVTGTTGKSTTAAMIHHIFTRAGFGAQLGGNIGGSLLNSRDQTPSDDWIVLELSSAMLYWLGERIGFPDARGWSPHVAVMTNLTSNHLDWHGSIDHYKNSKLNIFQYQRENDIRITQEEFTDSTADIPLLIPGIHNQMNARAAATVVSCVTPLSIDEAFEYLKDFRGLPHRLELIAERDGMRFYNDSKSTTPESTVFAVQALGNSESIHLIVGGYDKGISLKPIAGLGTNLAGLYGIGQTGSKIFGAEVCEHLEVAVERAIPQIKPGEILLLSPGCASWDQFRNFEERGERFSQLVRECLRQPTHIGEGL